MLTEQQKLDIQKVVEVMWEFDSGWDAGDDARQAAMRLQQWVGYSTPWDDNRKHLAKLSQPTLQSDAVADNPPPHGNANRPT